VGLIRHAFVFVIVLNALVVRTASAAEDGRAAAREAYAEGTRLYDVGDYREALAAFKRAYLSYEEPAFLFNMAQCYRQLDDKQEAIRAYKSYLRKSSHPANQAEVERIITELQAMLVQEKASQSSPPQGTMPPKSKQNETSGSEPSTAQSPTATPPVEEHTAATSAPLQAAPSEQQHEVRRTPLYKKWWLWTIVGVVVVGGGVALAVGLAESRGSGFNPTLNDFGPAAHALVTF
jgi:hypothetical protein